MPARMATRRRFGPGHERVGARRRPSGLTPAQRARLQRFASDPVRAAELVRQPQRERERLGRLAVDEGTRAASTALSEARSSRLARERRADLIRRNVEYGAPAIVRDGAEQLPNRPRMRHNLSDWATDEELEEYRGMSGEALRDAARAQGERNPFWYH